jgi:hypothetical protein
LQGMPPLPVKRPVECFSHRGVLYNIIEKFIMQFSRRPHQIEGESMFNINFGLSLCRSMKLSSIFKAVSCNFPGE